MSHLWRPVALAAALSVSALAGFAEAQTFVVRGVPAGETVEVVMAGTAVGTASATQAGDAHVATPTLTSREVPEVVVHIAADTCGTTHRLVLSDRSGIQPPPGVGCNRADINGLFVIRRATTVVIDLGRPSPNVLISQGPAPVQWTNPNREVVNPTGLGLTLSGGLSFVGFRDVVGHLCGDVAPCTASDYHPNYSLGARYWVTRNLAADVGFVQSGKTRSEGSGVSHANFDFKSSFETRVLSLAVAFGGPVNNAVRIYGRAGANFHDAVTTNVETTEEQVVILPDDSLVTLKGGTNTLVHRTRGWSFLLGAGFEVFPRAPFGFFIEGAVAPLKGHDADGGEAEIDDRTTMLLAGGRIYLGRIFSGRLLR